MTSVDPEELCEQFGDDIIPGLLQIDWMMRQLAVWFTGALFGCWHGRR